MKLLYKKIKKEVKQFCFVRNGTIRMNNIMKLLVFSAVSMLFAGCSTDTKKVIVPAIVPQTQKAETPKIRQDVIGAVEPIYLLPMKSAFDARIDTGAVTSSIDAKDIRVFERDGRKWVSFKVENRRSAEVYTFEKPVLKNIKIKRAEVAERRLKVMLPVRFGGRQFSTEFTLATRDDFDYQALVGRNILTGKYIVDTSLAHTLK